jgi:hypothetical protein
VLLTWDLSPAIISAGRDPNSHIQSAQLLAGAGNDYVFYNNFNDKSRFMVNISNQTRGRVSGNFSGRVYKGGNITPTDSLDITGTFRDLEIIVY